MREQDHLEAFEALLVDKYEYKSWTTMEKSIACAAFLYGLEIGKQNTAEAPSEMLGKMAVEAHRRRLERIKRETSEATGKNPGPQGSDD